MYLRNWDHNATSGTPISGAIVEARAATLTSPNTGPVLASTTTNADGMWEFPSLAESTHDIKITYTGNVWWHKGLTKHNVDYIYYTTPMPVTDNFLRNAGFEGGPAGPWTVTNVVQTVFGSWGGVNGAGSSAVVSRELTTKSGDSLVAAKIVQTKVSGSFVLFQDYVVPAAMRGKQVSLSVQIHQSVANAVRLYIADNTGATYSATSATTGAFVTLTVTRTIDSGATVAEIGISVDVSATVYADNAIWSLGAAPATYRPEYFSGYSLTNDLLATDAVDARVIAALAIGTAELQDDAVTLAKMANNSVGTAELIDANVTDVKMTNQKVNRTGDTMSGQLVFSGDGQGVNFAGGGHIIDVVATGTFLRANQNRLVIQNEAGSATMIQIDPGLVTALHNGAASGAFRINLENGTRAFTLTSNGSGGLLIVRDDSNAALSIGPGTTLTMNGAAVWSANNMANQATLLDRANHTGTQLAATISNFAATVAGLTAAALTGGWTPTTLLARANHTGTQLASTISDFASAAIAATAASYAALGHTHSYGNASAVTTTYTGNGAGPRTIGLGVSWTPLFAMIQVISGASNVSYLVANHDAATLPTGAVTSYTAGVGFAAGSITVPGAINSNAIGYRITAFGI